MSHYNFLEHSKEIYRNQKNHNLTIAKSRSEELAKLVLDPNSIDAQFKVLVADLRYRLSSFKKILDAEEQTLKLQPFEIRKKLEQQLLDFYGELIVGDINHYATQMEPLATQLKAEQHFVYKTYFQEHLLEFVTYSSKFSTRAIEKPNGYAGDYLMMDMLCDENVYHGNTLFEKCVHRFSVTSPSGAPVKNRVALIYEQMKDSLHQQQKQHQQLKVLDLACGPSLYTQKFIEQHPIENIKFFFLDQDPESIEYLQLKLQSLCERHHKPLNAHYYTQNFQQLLMDPSVIEEISNQNFIVSSGLFDYVDENTFSLLANFLFTLLAPGGTLLIGNLCPRETTKIFQWYVNEWPLNFRTEEKLLQLAPPKAKTEILAEQLGYNLFLKMTK